MDLVKILYEPNFIIIIISLIIAVISYFIFKNMENEKKDKNKEKDKNNMALGKKVLYTFLITFVSLLVLYHGAVYLNKSSFFAKGEMKGGFISNTADQLKDKIVENLTIIADDVDCGLLED